MDIDWCASIWNLSRNFGHSSKECSCDKLFSDVLILQPFVCSVTCILRWAVYKTSPWCPQCRLPFMELYVYRALDGRYKSYSTYYGLEPISCECFGWPLFCCHAGVSHQTKTFWSLELQKLLQYRILSRCMKSNKACGYFGTSVSMTIFLKKVSAFCWGLLGSKVFLSFLQLKSLRIIMTRKIALMITISSLIWGLGIGGGVTMGTFVLVVERPAQLECDILQLQLLRHMRQDPLLPEDGMLVKVKRRHHQRRQLVVVPSVPRNARRLINCSPSNSSAWGSQVDG